MTQSDRWRRERVRRGLAVQDPSTPGQLFWPRERICITPFGAKQFGTILQRCFGLEASKNPEDQVYEVLVTSRYGKKTRPICWPFCMHRTASQVLHSKVEIKKPFAFEVGNRVRFVEDEFEILERARNETTGHRVYMLESGFFVLEEDLQV